MILVAVSGSMERAQMEETEEQLLLGVSSGLRWGLSHTS